jgi:hypothetical protein
MLSRRLNGVQWKKPLLIGVIDGPVAAAVLHLSDDHPFGGGVRGFALTSLVGGGGLALLLMVWTTRIRRRADQAADPSGTAARAVAGGADMSDPEVRAAARRRLLHHLDAQRRHPAFRPIIAVPLMVLLLLGGIFSSHWLLLFLPVFGGLFLLIRWQRTFLERQAAALGDDPTPAEASSASV